MVHTLAPGEFTWHPERSPKGPVAVVVSVPEQRVHVYRNGMRIGVSTCSTGKEGHTTPAGVFTILEKDKDHRSSTYHNAPMPNMQRLTWDGIALHAGGLPGSPGSAGCQPALGSGGILAPGGGGGDWDARLEAGEPRPARMPALQGVPALRRAARQV